MGNPFRPGDSLQITRVRSETNFVRAFTIIGFYSHVYVHLAPLKLAFRLKVIQYIYCGKSVLFFIVAQAL